MITKPQAFRAHAMWSFRLRDANNEPYQRTLVQTAVMRYDPADDVVPMLVALHEKFAGRRAVSLQELAEFKEVKWGVRDSSIAPLGFRTAGSDHFDFVDVLYSSMLEMYKPNEAHQVLTRWKTQAPSFAWEVVREDPQVLEVGFHMYGADGKIEPMYDIAPCAPELTIEALNAPTVVTHLFHS